MEPKYLHDWIAEENEDGLSLAYIEEDGRHELKIPAWLWTRMREHVKREAA